MFRIGDFSKLSRVSVKTLRYYDQVGLLKPARVDRFTNYRYYSVEHFHRLNRILALKDMGFSLEQIVRLLDEGLPPAQLRGMLRMKQAEVQQKVQEEQDRLTRVEARLKQIEEEGIMSAHDVVIKKAETLDVASIRDTVPAYDQQGTLWGELSAYLAEQGGQMDGTTGDCLPRYRVPRERRGCRGLRPGGAPVPGNERVIVKQLPGVEAMACVVHHGSYSNGFHEAYGNLMSWIEANGYRIVGPNREIYLKGGDDPDDGSYVTEIQFPVEKT
jgi:DNA-binding transcriptional MerR regulator